MEQTKKQINISVTMCHALRHDPKQYGLEIDEYGFVDINLLLEGLKKCGGKKCKDLTMQELEDIVRTCPKQRYEIKGDKIRAQGGHNKNIGKTIIKTIAIPPDIMYHGTTMESACIILQEGLKGMDRQNANLSIDIETAEIVGKRRAKKPTILIVDCKRAYNDKIKFYLESNGIYSVEFMPAKYIKKYIY